MIMLATVVAANAVATAGIAASRTMRIQQLKYNNKELIHHNKIHYSGLLFDGTATIKKSAIKADMVYRAVPKQTLSNMMSHQPVTFIKNGKPFTLKKVIETRYLFRDMESLYFHNAAEFQQFCDIKKIKLFEERSAETTFHYKHVSNVTAHEITTDTGTKLYISDMSDDEVKHFIMKEVEGFSSASATSLWLIALMSAGFLLGI